MYIPVAPTAAPAVAPITDPSAARGWRSGVALPTPVFIKRTKLRYALIITERHLKDTGHTSGS